MSLTREETLVEANLGLLCQLEEVKQILRDLLATIELHTDCMDGQIDRVALDADIEKAEQALGIENEELITRINRRRNPNFRSYHTHLLKDKS